MAIYGRGVFNSFLTVLCTHLTKTSSLDHIDGENETRLHRRLQGKRNLNNATDPFILVRLGEGKGAQRRCGNYRSIGLPVSGRGRRWTQGDMPHSSGELTSTPSIEAARCGAVRSFSGDS
ncbi:hypothetical protein J6590_048967 [Homalodisca vitripennis]|nr:hypothetical protein J6590_048967 [Homalodisca vitripennis]